MKIDKKKVVSNKAFSNHAMTGFTTSDCPIRAACYSTIPIAPQRKVNQCGFLVLEPNDVLVCAYKVKEEQPMQDKKDVKTGSSL